MPLSRFRALHDAASGRYFYEDTATGETSWDAPQEWADAAVLAGTTVEGAIVAVAEDAAAAEPLPDMASPRNAMAALKISQVIKLRRKARAMKGKMFEKHLDEGSGRWYFVYRPTGESTWDMPPGGAALAPLPTPRAKGIALENALYKADRARDRRERRALIELRSTRFAEEKEKREAEAAAEAEAEVDGLWAEAFKVAAETGELNLSWRKLGFVHEVIYSFAETYGRRLVSLRLIGHELEELPSEVGENCLSLTSLSLASNRLAALPDSLCNLTKLVDVNLLRNQITRLPDDIGDLVELRNLLIASNRLESLPATFGNLTNLKRVVLECNKLARMPETLSRMTCHTLNLNANELVALPHCIKSMASLQTLSANENLLRQLPRDLGESTSLTSIHAVSNRISELPDSMGNMTGLRSLWLDHNNMTSLPWNFFKMTNLVELNMEGNSDMVYPTVDKLIQGAEAVRRWSNERHRHSVFVRKQRIVTTMQDLFEQVLETNESAPTPQDKICSAAFFEPRVEADGDMWFQIVVDHFWEKTLESLQEMWDTGRARKGRVTNLPYEIDECMQTMREFRDPYGLIMRENVTGLFRRCGCVDPATGARRVCVPPQPGWMCQRVCTLYKMHIVLEREKIARDLLEREKAETEEAAFAASAAAREFTESEDGKLYFFHRAKVKADEVMAERKKKRWGDKNYDKMSKELDVCNKKYDKKAEKAKATLEASLKAYKEQLEELEKEEDAAPAGYAREKLGERIEEMMAKIHEPEEEKAVQAVEDERKAELQEIEEKWTGKDYKKPGAFTSYLGKFEKEHRVLVEELAVDLIRVFTEREQARARKKIEEQHRKMRIIRVNWQGLGGRECFIAWRRFTKRNRRQRAKDSHTEDREQQRADAEIGGTVKLARWRLSQWIEGFDPWSDLPFWTQTTTGNVVWAKPLLADTLPPGFEMHKYPELDPDINPDTCDDAIEAMLASQPPQDEPHADEMYLSTPTEGTDGDNSQLSSEGEDAYKQFKAGRGDEESEEESSGDDDDDADDDEAEEGAEGDGEEAKDGEGGEAKEGEEGAVVAAPGAEGAEEKKEDGEEKKEDGEEKKDGEGGELVVAEGDAGEDADDESEAPSEAPSSVDDEPCRGRLIEASKAAVEYTCDDDDDEGKALARNADKRGVQRKIEAETALQRMRKRRLYLQHEFKEELKPEPETLKDALGNVLGLVGDAHRPDGSVVAEKVGFDPEREYTQVELTQMSVAAVKKEKEMAIAAVKAERDAKTAAKREVLEKKNAEKLERKRKEAAAFAAKKPRA